MECTERHWLATCLVGATLILSISAWALPDIRVNGLFPGQAALTIDGRQRLLKEGATSPEGVKLISSDSERAIVEVDGRRSTLNLSRHISSTYRKAKAAEARISRGPGGHYSVGGNINGHAVQFLVDTGATAIAMNHNDAERLGLDFRKGRAGRANTAAGIVETLHITMPKVTVGSITLWQVEAAVVTGTHPRQILLGNSFLSRVQMAEEGGVMVLRKAQ